MPLDPIPALPDTERRTPYSVTTSTTGPFDVGFHIYADGTDFLNWIEVLVNGVKVTTGWTLTSPTGPLANLNRPITDAVITFTAPLAGTVGAPISLAIVGARRPRRLFQFGEAPTSRDFNRVLTDIVAWGREMFDKLKSAVTVPYGEGGLILPTLAERGGNGEGTSFHFNGSGLAIVRGNAVVTPIGEPSLVVPTVGERAAAGAGTYAGYGPTGNPIVIGQAPLGFEPRGDYIGATVYSYLDVVTNQGASWVYLNLAPGSGNAPPLLPTTSNAHWQLMAAPGAAGAGAAQAAAEAVNAAATMAIVENRGWPLVPALNLVLLPEQTQLPAPWTWARASVKKTCGPDLSWREVAANLPAHHFDPLLGHWRGVWSEGPSTNHVRNTVLDGVVDDPTNTPPTNMSIAQAGLTLTIVRHGVDKGVNYFDYRLNGTTTAGVSILNLDAATQIVAATGERWAIGCFVAIIAGSTANITNFQLGVEERDAGGVNLATNVSVIGPPSSDLQRYKAVQTLAEATVAFVRPVFRINTSIGVAIDITMRVGWPTAEKRATVTSPIVTTGAAATRAGDLPEVATLSGWLNTRQHVLMWRGSIDDISGNIENILALDDNTADELERLVIGASGVPQFSVIDGGVVQATCLADIPLVGIDFTLAGRAQANNFAICKDGSIPDKDAGGSLPTPTKLRLGYRAGGVDPSFRFDKQIHVFGLALVDDDLSVVSLSPGEAASILGL